MVSVKVLFDYEAEQDDELSLKVGEIVTNVDKQDGGWWEGDLNKKRGVFPENFVEEIKDNTPAYKKKVKVTFQYDKEQDDELSLQVGDIIDIIDDDDEGWWKGILNGKVGVFPSNFVEVMKSDTASSKPEPEPEPESVQTVDKGRPKSQHMGFGLKLEDLSRNKLKKVGSGKPAEPKAKEEPLKPIQMVSPMGHASKDSDTKVQPSSTTTKTVQKAKVIFSYEPEQEDELKLSIGDILVITDSGIFEGWMQGELNGKVGLFPDNFVEMLPVEIVKADSNALEPPKPITSKNSLKRAAKEDPSKAAASKAAAVEKPKPGFAIFPPGAKISKQELEKKIGNKPPPPDTKKPGNKGPAPPPPASKKPKPALPSQPKPPKPPAPATVKTEEGPSIPSAAAVPDIPRTLSYGGVSEQQKKPFNRTKSDSGKKIVPAHDKHESKPVVSEPDQLDFDSVKPTDALKHMQRAKPPSKNPPSKFKRLSSGKDVEDGNAHANGLDNSKEVNELKSEVAELKSKMNEMEKKFKKLLTQVTEDLDSERKSRLNQQVEIDRLKKQLSLFAEN